MRLCYLYFGAITDLGWTFTYNAGRLRVHDVLTEEFPDIAFESLSTQNVFFSSNRSAIVDARIADGCHVILTNNELLLDSRDAYYAEAYPNVSFVLLNHTLMTAATRPNLLYLSPDFTGGYYVAGAAAGAQAQRCIAFLAAWSHELDPVNAYSGFLLGVRSVNATVPVHVISQESWFFPDSDAVLTDLFLRVKECDIVARYSDPSVVDVAVYGSGRAGTFSVSPHSNLQEYVGDTVLTSVYIDWSVALLSVLRPLVANGTLDRSRVHFYGMRDGAIRVAPVSPRATHAAKDAAEAAVARLAAANDSVVCGLLRLSRGGTVPYEPGMTCKQPWQNLGDFVVDDHVTVHPAYADRASCPAGSRYRYAFRRNGSSSGSGSGDAEDDGGDDALLRLECSPCPANTYSTAPASSVCSPCATGSIADAGATSCSPRPVLSPLTIAGVAISGFVVALLLALFFVNAGVARIRNRFAPREAPLCIVLTDVDSSSALWRAHPSAMRTATDVYRRVIRSVVARNAAFEVKSIGDGAMIATRTVLEGALVALDLQRELTSVLWPAALDEFGGFQVRIGVEYCDDAVVRYDHLQRQYDYIGSSVANCARMTATARGGFVTMSDVTLSVLRSDPHYVLLIEPLAMPRLWCVGTRPGRNAALYVLLSRGDERLSDGTDPGTTAAVTGTVDASVALDALAALDEEPAVSRSTGSVVFTGDIPTPVATAVLFATLDGAGGPTRAKGVVAALCDAYGLDPVMNANPHRLAATIASLLTASRTMSSPGVSHGADSHPHLPRPHVQQLQQLQQHHRRNVRAQQPQLPHNPLVPNDDIDDDWATADDTTISSQSLPRVAPHPPLLALRQQAVRRQPSDEAQRRRVVGDDVMQLVQLPAEVDAHGGGAPGPHRRAGGTA